MHIYKVQHTNVQTERTEEYKAPTEETAWSRLKKALGPVAVVGVFIAKLFANLKLVMFALWKFLTVRLHRKTFCEAQAGSFAAPEVSARPVEVRRHHAADDLDLHATLGMAVRGGFCSPFARP